MKRNIKGYNIYHGNKADLPSKDKTGVIFVAFDTGEIFTYDNNGDPQLLGSGSTPASHTHTESDITDLKSYTEKVAVPATATSTGTAGQVAFESGFAYFCVADDTWERVAIATWV